MNNNTWLSISHLLILAVLFKGTLANNNSSTTVYQLLPVNRIEYRPVAYRVTDTGGGPFQQCLLCRCCAANDPNDCSSMSCCFGIDCDLPAKPYGVCAFVPKSCYCTSCS